MRGLMEALYHSARFKVAISLEILIKSEVESDSDDEAQNSKEDLATLD